MGNYLRCGSGPAVGCGLGGLGDYGTGQAGKGPWPFQGEGPLLGGVSAVVAAVGWVHPDQSVFGGPGSVGLVGKVVAEKDFVS